MLLRTRAPRHWSLPDLLPLLLPSTPPRACALAVRRNSSTSSRDSRDPLSARSAKPATTRSDPRTRAPKSPKDSRGRDTQARHDAATNANGVRSTTPRTWDAPRTPMPWNFRAIPDTERIEGIEREAAHDLIARRAGTYSVSSEAFNIKAARMPFREPPPPPALPTFVRKALLQYEFEMARYNQHLKELEKRQEQPSDKGNASETLSISTPSTSPSLPPPPKLPQLVLQYQLRNTRQYPPTVDAPHPAFRVSFILSKKLISKLATDRNFARKKLSAAAEMVFRDYARQGYEYLIFGKPACVTTPQADLIELMKEILINPALYGGKFSQRNSTSASTSSTSTSSTSTSSNSTNSNGITSHDGTGDEEHFMGPLEKTLGPHDIVTIRWKNNRPPLRKTWWKHAHPNPLGRVQQSDAYLDRFVANPPKRQAGEPK